jgi:benzaldehyde dehydrogenase (NAD)
VVDAIAEEFAAKFREKIGGTAVGDPRGETTPLGAVIDPRTVECVTSLIEDALAKGATQLTGGETTGNVLMPAYVMDNVTPEYAAVPRGSFGPVVAVTRARDVVHAVELANDTECGLSASVFTRDIARGLKIARRIQSGICHVNGPTVHDEAQMPFGGMKASGYGRFGGEAGIDAFTELRRIAVETEPGHFDLGDDGARSPCGVRWPATVRRRDRRPSRADRQPPDVGFPMADRRHDGRR